jgi:hypothetical protein
VTFRDGISLSARWLLGSSFYTYGRNVVKTSQGDLRDNPGTGGFGPRMRVLRPRARARGKVAAITHLTKQSSVAASESTRGFGFEGFSHVKTRQNAGSPSAAAIG